VIIEGLITCASDQGPHVSALGPVVNPNLTEWQLRPYQTSRIFALLRANPTCVFHVIDDALPVVRLVLGLEPELTFDQLECGAWVVREACHWYRLEVESWNLDEARSEARARRVEHGVLRPFWGWNRAKHALLEAAILISRAEFTPPAQLDAALEALRSPIEKTAGPREFKAWELIEHWRRAPAVGPFRSRRDHSH
jgi:hypothetical protein